jgi:hypothetical protein
MSRLIANVVQRGYRRLCHGAPEGTDCHRGSYPLHSQLPCTDSLPDFKDPVEVQYLIQCTVMSLPDSKRLERGRITATVVTHESMCMAVMKGRGQRFGTLVGRVEDTGNMLKA